MISFPIEYRKKVLDYSNYGIIYANVEFVEDFGPWNAGEKVNQLDFNCLNGMLRSDDGRDMLVKVAVVNK